VALPRTGICPSRRLLARNDESHSFLWCRPLIENRSQRHPIQIAEAVEDASGSLAELAIRPGALVFLGGHAAFAAVDEPFAIERHTWAAVATGTVDGRSEVLGFGPLTSLREAYVQVRAAISGAAKCAKEQE
jgi:hypothetical protein